MSTSLLKQIQKIQSQVDLLEQSLEIKVHQQIYRIHSNSQKLLGLLEDYFHTLAQSQTSNIKHENLTEIHVYETDQLADLIAQTQWTDWKREGGKVGRKDAILDSEWNDQRLRLLYKVKTGMLFLQPGPDAHHQLIPLALGPAEANSSQIINFILTQHLNQHLRLDWQLGHTSGMQIQQKGLAFAGLSGGGKSTLMLHLLAQAEHFISNDRLLLKRHNNRLMMRGIPKQPRINPGTIVHNPRLHSLMSERERNEYLALPSETLRAIEKKYDAPVHYLYHKDCYLAESPLDALFILNWQAHSSQPTSVSQVKITERIDLLPAIMKSPGPFYATAESGFLKNGAPLVEANYLKLLQATTVYEITGKIDFEAAQQQILALFQT
ncbi:MAG: HprK-related kinase B [Pseudomonadota bacterium]|nr:HprK-related kinase B [Pseudomonadota bacterium]